MTLADWANVAQLFDGVDAIVALAGIIIYHRWHASR